MTKRDTPTVVRAKEETMDDQEILTSALLAMLGAPTVELDMSTYVVMRPLVTALGLDWPATCVALSDNSGGLDLAVIRRRERGKNRATPLICMLSYDLPEWLTTVDPSQVRPEIADEVRQFQERYERVLEEDLDHWQGAEPVEWPPCKRIVETPEEGEANNKEQSRRVEARKEKRTRLIKELTAVNYQDEVKLAELVAMGMP